VFEDLEDQVAVVTGGARGLGFTMAKGLAKWGTNVALLDVLPAVQESARTIHDDFGVKSTGVIADVTDDKDIEAAFTEVSRTLGPTANPHQRCGDHGLGVQRRCFERVL
jgi:NAD(P)-dependent dehydrogenase (short-subunit alcohol dehydrogenase family)